MRYTIYKIRNGCWRLEWEDGKYSEHSTKDGAMKMAFLLTGQKVDILVD